MTSFRKSREVRPVERLSDNIGIDTNDSPQFRQAFSVTRLQWRVTRTGVPVCSLAVLPISPQGLVGDFPIGRAEQPQPVTLRLCEGRYKNRADKNGGWSQTGPLKESPSAGTNAVSHARARARGFRWLRFAEGLRNTHTASPKWAKSPVAANPAMGLLSSAPTEPSRLCLPGRSGDPIVAIV